MPGVAGVRRIGAEGKDVECEEADQALDGTVAGVLAAVDGAADASESTEGLVSIGEEIVGGKELERRGFRERGYGFRISWCAEDRADRVVEKTKSILSDDDALTCVDGEMFDAEIPVLDDWESGMARLP